MDIIIVALAPDGAIEAVPLEGYNRIKSQFYERELARFKNYDEALNYIRHLCKYVVVQKCNTNFEIDATGDWEVCDFWAGFVSFEDAEKYKNNMNGFLSLPLNVL